MNTIDKTAKIKEKLKVYQETDEYKNKLQFDLKFENDDDPVGIYTYEDELFVLTGEVGIHILIISMKKLSMKFIIKFANNGKFLL